MDKLILTVTGKAWGAGHGRKLLAFYTDYNAVTNLQKWPFTCKECDAL